MGMQLRRWNSLPDVMKTKEVRKYYNIIKRRQGSLKLKKVFDVVVASIMLIFLAIPMLVIAVCIKLDSRGPFPTRRSSDLYFSGRKESHSMEGYLRYISSVLWLSMRQSLELR